MVTCGYAQGTTLRHAHPRAIVLNSVDSLTFNASHFSHTPSHSNSAPRPWISQPTNRTPDTVHRARHTAHHTPARGLPEPQRNNRTLPNNVARNSPRSFFDYASKRCNSNAANSKFEIVSRELRATLIEQARRRPTAPGGKQARRPTAPGGKQALRHQDRVPESEGTVNPGG